MAGHRFELGDGLIDCISAGHWRTVLDPEPQRLNPDRFLARDFSSSEYLPFSGSARQCISASLALFELKLILVNLLGQYSFELCTENDRPIQPVRRGFTLGTERPVRLRVWSLQATAG
jgi:cytochrome P450